MRRTTDQTANLWDDERASRFVVHRKARGISRKTTVRYDLVRSKPAARAIASDLCAALKTCPERELARFRFSREDARKER